MTRIVIYVDGGVVQDVYSSDPDTKVMLVDYDEPEENRPDAEDLPFHVF